MIGINKNPISFSEYQHKTRDTAIYGESVARYVCAIPMPEDSSLSVSARVSLNTLLRRHYVALGLTSEAGEVAGLLKKLMRDDAGKLSAEKKAALSAELGDVLWYLARIAGEFGLDLSQIAEANLAKLYDRKERGALQGSGDKR